MLIYRLHHPLLHDASRMWPMNINIGSRLLILEPDARPRRAPLSMFSIAEMSKQAQRFFIRKVLGLFPESLN